MQLSQRIIYRRWIKGVMKIWSKFTGEHPCQSAISIKLFSNFIEIALRHGCSPVNLLHIILFLGTPLGDCFYIYQFPGFVKSSWGATFLQTSLHNYKIIFKLWRNRFWLEITHAMDMVLPCKHKGVAL